MPTSRSKVHKIKTQAYQDHGAEIAAKLDSPITHYVVTRKWDYKDVLKSLKVDALPSGSVVVRDAWASDCIESNKLLEIGQNFIEPPQEEKKAQDEKEEEPAPKKKKRSNSKSKKETSDAGSKDSSSPVVNEDSAEQAGATQESAITEEHVGDDVLKEYVRKAGLEGVIKEYITDSDGEDEDSGREIAIFREPSPSDDPEKKDGKESWTPYSVLLNKPPGGLEHNPNWRTIEIVSFAYKSWCLPKANLALVQNDDGVLL